MYTAIDLLENWPYLESSRKSGSPAAGLLLQEIEDALIEVTTEQFTILKLYFYYGYSQKEIATFLGITQQAVAKSIKHAVRDLDQTKYIRGEPSV